MEKSKLLFGEGFRVFFLSAGIYAVFSIVVWGSWLGGQYLGRPIAEMPFAPSPYQWHAHEMIFGYTSAALAGFLLTAVPSWTGAQAARHLFVGSSFAVWLLGRVALCYGGALPAGLVAIADLAFLPIVGAKIATQLLKRPKPQNMMFLAFLTMIWIANLMVHLEWMEWSVDTLETGMRAGLLGICSMIAILGGRVTPAFTRNAMKRVGLPDTAWPAPSRIVLESASLALAVLLPLVLLLRAPDAVAGAVALAAGCVQIARLTGWRGRYTLDKPILLALHLAMGMLAIGLILWGLAVLGAGNEVAALHVLGIGAVGGMTLAVMSRAVLGHTGRPLVAPAPIALAYALVAAAALLRWLGSSLPGAWYLPSMLLSAGLWSLAFSLYVIAIWPAVTTPRLASES